MEKRINDRRKKKVDVEVDRRKGPRRLTCECGGKIEVKIADAKSGEFVCLRCGKNH